MYKTSHNTAIKILRFTTAVIFIWFGLLFLAGIDPSPAAFASGLPYFGFAGGGLIYGLLSFVAGILLITGKFPLLGFFLLLSQLIGTIFLAAVARDLLFAPAFPVLTIIGLLVLASVGLSIAGMVLFFDIESRE